MPNYLLSFRTPSDYTSTPGTQTAWNQFFDGISSHLEDIGNPIFTRQSVGQTGADTLLGGYSLINADSLQEASELAAACPLVKQGGGVEIGEVTPLSETLAAAHTSDQPTTA
jgi:YCII-related domain